MRWKRMAAVLMVLASAAFAEYPAVAKLDYPIQPATLGTCTATATVIGMQAIRWETDGKSIQLAQRYVSIKGQQEAGLGPFGALGSPICGSMAVKYGAPRLELCPTYLLPVQKITAEAEADAATRRVVSTRICADYYDCVRAVDDPVNPSALILGLQWNYTCNGPVIEDYRIMAGGSHAIAVVATSLDRRDEAGEPYLVAINPQGVPNRVIEISPESAKTMIYPDYFHKQLITGINVVD